MKEEERKNPRRWKRGDTSSFDGHALYPSGDRGTHRLMILRLARIFLGAQCKSGNPACGPNVVRGPPTQPYWATSGGPEGVDFDGKPKLPEAKPITLAFRRGAVDFVT